jgi:hypothetical protein
MKSEKLEVVRGSGNVFCDLGNENADAEQFKAILAAEIIKTLDRDRPSVRGAHSRTGIAAADFERIRQCRPQAVHCRSAYVYHLSARIPGRSEGQSAAR